MRNKRICVSYISVSALSSNSRSTSVQWASRIRANKAVLTDVSIFMDGVIQVPRYETAYTVSFEIHGIY